MKPVYVKIKLDDLVEMQQKAQWYFVEHEKSMVNHIKEHEKLFKAQMYTVPFVDKDGKPIKLGDEKGFTYQKPKRGRPKGSKNK